MKFPSKLLRGALFLTATAGSPAINTQKCEEMANAALAKQKFETACEIFAQLNKPEKTREACETAGDEALKNAYKEEALKYFELADLSKQEIDKKLAEYSKNIKKIAVFAAFEKQQRRDAGLEALKNGDYKTAITLFYRINDITNLQKAIQLAKEQGIELPEPEPIPVCENPPQ